MPQCVLCNEFMPSPFMEETDDKLAMKCQFCIRETKSIEYVKDEQLQVVTKDWVISEYKKYIVDLIDNNEKIKSIVKPQDV